jgi:hypothetical protein
MHTCTAFSQVEIVTELEDRIRNIKSMALCLMDSLKPSTEIEGADDGSSVDG